MSFRQCTPYIYRYVTNRSIYTGARISFCLDALFLKSIVCCLSVQEDEEDKLGWRLESEVTKLREAAEAQHKSTLAAHTLALEQLQVRPLTNTIKEFTAVVTHNVLIRSGSSCRFVRDLRAL